MVRRHLYAFAFSALFACASAASAVALTIERGFYRAVAFVLDVLARPAAFIPTFARVATAGGPAFAYDAPPPHFLRHEGAAPPTATSDPTTAGREPDAARRAGQGKGPGGQSPAPFSWA